MFGRLGFWEIAIILIIALVVFGPNKLPELGKALGRGIREFKDATNKLTEEINRDDKPAAKAPAPAAAPAAVPAATAQAETAAKPETAAAQPAQGSTSSDGNDTATQA